LQPIKSPVYYASVVDLSIGPVEWVDFDETTDEEELPPEIVRGRFFRIAVTTSEEMRSYYIEQITIGDEGCCIEIASISEIDIYDLERRLKLPTWPSLEPVRWTSPTSYIFEAKDRRFEIRNLGDSVPIVVELNQ